MKNGFTCKEQEEGFRELLKSMAENPQDYITPDGRMTTNTVEGFHGLSLMYRAKRTDLQHEHYTCKSDMGICHKVYCIYNMYYYLRYHLSKMSVEYGPNLEGPVLYEYGCACSISGCEWHLRRATTVGDETR